MKVTEECLERGIAVCKDGASFKKIGKRIRSDGSLPSVMVGFRLINCNGFIWIEDGSCMEIHEKLKSLSMLKNMVLA